MRKMTVSAATKSLVQFAYRGGMPIVAASEAAGVSITSARRWVKGINPDPAASPASELAELVAAVRRVECEIAFDPRRMRSSCRTSPSRRALILRGCGGRSGARGSAWRC
jgi:hypothetical protein